MSKTKDEPDITLRDYFAGQALSGLLSTGMHVHVAVPLAYQIADAMIKERKWK